MTFNEEIAYQVMEPLKVGIVLTEKLSGDSDVKPYLKFKPYLEYRVLEPVLVGVEVPVAIQKDVIDLDLTVKPWVKYELDENAYLKLFYALNMVTPAGGDSGTNHAIQLDFVYKF
jgi:hypothetical protein